MNLTKIVVAVVILLVIVLLISTNCKRDPRKGVSSGIKSVANQHYPTGPIMINGKPKTCDNDRQCVVTKDFKATIGWCNSSKEAQVPEGPLGNKSTCYYPKPDNWGCDRAAQCRSLCCSGGSCVNKKKEGGCSKDCECESESCTYKLFKGHTCNN
mgnify:CR=1 FL=1